MACPDLLQLHKPIEDVKQYVKRVVHPNSQWPRDNENMTKVVHPEYIYTTYFFFKMA